MHFCNCSPNPDLWARYRQHCPNLQIQRHQYIFWMHSQWQTSKMDGKTLFIKSWLKGQHDVSYRFFYAAKKIWWVCANFFKQTESFYLRLLFGLFHFKMFVAVQHRVYLENIQNHQTCQNRIFHHSFVSIWEIYL